jgi:hypothetical protein
MQTLLLPCRHVIFFRYRQSYESAIPPPKFYTSRWSLFAPANDISTGHVDVGGLHTVRRRPSAHRALTRDQKYSEARALCQQLQGVMTDQNTEDFKSTCTLIQTVQNLCRAGEIRKLADAMAVIESQQFANKPKKRRQDDSRQEEKKSTKGEDTGIDAAPAIKQEGGGRPYPPTLKFSKSAKKTRPHDEEKARPSKRRICSASTVAPSCSHEVYPRIRQDWRRCVYFCRTHTALTSLLKWYVHYEVCFVAAYLTLVL